MRKQTVIKFNKPIYVFSKKVNDSQITQNKITRNSDSQKIGNVVASLKNLGKIKLAAELDLKQNCRSWITSILKQYPEINDRDVTEVLNDFTDSMNTRMREEEKYAICIIDSSTVILCHSVYGEETITPTCEVINRMLDKDNVLRYVYFENDKNDVKTIYYEETPSLFFANWLGINEKEAFEYLGGKNRLCGEINGTSFVLECTDDDFDKKFIQEKSFRIKDNQLILPSPIQNIPLVMIKVGNKPYKESGDFIQDFLAKKYNLTHYQEEYTKIMNSLSVWSTKIIDDEHQVKTAQSKVLVDKTNTNFLIIFDNGSIEIRPSFLSKIKSKLLNNDSFRIFHAAGRLTETPLQIKNMEIYNELNKNLATVLLNYYSSLKIKDGLDNILLHVIFKVLCLENRDKKISCFFEKLASALLSEINPVGSFVNGESELLEFKSREFVSGNNDGVVKNLSEDILTKMKYSKNKIYVLGANESTKEFEPMSISKFSDSRIDDLKTKLIAKTDIREIELLKVPINNAKDCLLILMIGCQNEKTR